jgi:hypothetical protein
VGNLQYSHYDRITQRSPPLRQMRYLLSMFDLNANIMLDREELIELLHMVFKFFKHSGFIRVGIDREEVESLVTRVFFMEKIDPSQGMTMYEAKEWLRMLVSRSRAICTLLNCTWENSELSTYQRQAMPVVHQLEKGMLTVTDLKYHLAKTLVTFRPLLGSDNKMTMHERALARGADDPLKPDYSRFLPKKSKKTLSKVVPLTHGHLGSYLDWRRVEMDHAATMLQAIVRGIAGRKEAEFRAKILAFERAKVTALQRMREKVHTEILSKEQLTGMEKLKYDAKIRNRAAKMRAAGLPSEREDVIAAMIREGLEAGEREIQLRFREIAREKGLDKYMDNPDEGVQDLKGAVTEQYVDLTAMVAEVSKTATAIAQGPAAGETAADQEARRPSMFINLKGVKDGPDEDRIAKRRDAVVHGRHPPDLFDTGEAFEEQFLRFEMIMTDISREGLYKRLRALEGVLTQMKAEEMMLELPSKRLLLTLVDYTSKYLLPQELKEHFRITRNSNVVAEVFRDVLNSDLEFGVIRSSARRFYQSRHGIVESHFEAAVQKGLKKATEMVVKAGKSAAMSTLTVEERIEKLCEREIVQMRKKEDILVQNTGNLEKITKKINNARAALEELGRRMKDMDRYLINKVRKDPLLEDLPVEKRYDWYKRYDAARRWPDDTPEDNRLKYCELSNVVKEFLHVSGRTAILIVNEFYLPVHRKTIKPVVEKAGDGRAKEGGRGDQGLRFKYEAFNIRFKILMDDHGIFNGSDELAAKLGGAERRNSLEVMKLYLNGVGVPLVTTVDYHGFRVLAVAKMPVELLKYSDTGDLRSRKEDFVFGTRNRGDTFVDSERKLDVLLEHMSKRLNLSRHGIKAFRDLNTKLIWSSSDIRGFKGEDGTFHLLNFWRLMPPEFPGLAQHLVSPPRDMSMFYRFLRPEFVTKHPEALSPDANLIITKGVADCDRQLDGIKAASTKLLNETIQAFAEYLCKQPITAPAWQGFGLDVTTNMHRYGINVRHLGLIRSMFWRKLGFKCNVVFNSRKFVTHGDLRHEIARGAQIRVKDTFHVVSSNPRDEFSEKAITVMEKVRDLSENHVDVYAGEVSDSGNSEQMRVLLLAEIAARTTKNVMRSYLRMIMKIMKTSAEYMQVELVVEFLNVLTGSHPQTSEFWADQLYHSMIARYGRFAVSYVERPNLRFVLEPMVIYIVQRLSEMVGFTLARDCLASFHKSPRSFRFTSGDILTPVVRIKHNVPLLNFADAMLLNLQADSISQRCYSDHVMEDEPLLYWRCGERRGSKLAYNYGAMGNGAAGSYSPGVIFEAQGPIRNEEINRAVRFRAEDKAKIDTVPIPELAPVQAEKHLSVEIWVRCTGFWDTHRVLLMNSRYGIAATRENKWVFQIYSKYVQATLTGPEIARGEWTHIVATYDGTIMRMYINAKLAGAVELASELFRQLELLKEERREAYEKLDSDEKKAKDGCWRETEESSQKYFVGKEGRQVMRRAAMKLVEQSDFQARIAAQNAELDDGPREVIKKLTKDEALELAKQNYTKEQYGKNVQTINEQFKTRREELMDLHKKQDYEADLKLTTTLRVGGTGPNSSSNVGQFFFEGEICHFAIYDKELKADRVQDHYLSGTQERSIESERLYFLAAEKFKQALQFAPNDPTILQKYAESVCNFVQTDGAQQVNERRTKNKIVHAVEVFKALENFDAIAEVLRRLPGEYGFSDTACDIFNEMCRSRPDYFSTPGSYFDRKALAGVPNKFLLYESVDDYQIETAARMYQMVMTDPELMLFYGDDDLTFLCKLKNPRVILTMVKQVQSGSDKRIVDINAYRDCTDIDDDDLHVVADYRRAAIVMNLRGCKRVTDKSIKDVARYCTGLNALTIDGCPQISNEGIAAIKRYCKDLQLLSMEKCIRITDPALITLTESADRLKVLNFNQCTQLSDAIMAPIGKNCRMLELLHLAYCFLITDAGMYDLTTTVNKNSLTSLDLTACKGLTDDGYELLGKGLPNLTYLNLSSARITNIGMKVITHNCWKLQTLIMEDLYLISDDVFFFDVAGDGRREADEKMLVCLTELNLTDCTRLTNRALAGISTRCKELAYLKLNGCSNFTDEAIDVLLKEPRYGQARGENITRLHLAYCIQLTNRAIKKICEACERMDVLDLAGLVHLTDDVVHSIAQYCPHLQTLSLARNRRLTDRTLCILADYLWIEDLDMAHCSKLTDEGVEVLAVELNGLKRLNVSWCYRLTERSMRVLARNCKSLEVLNISECAGIPDYAIDEMQKELPRLKILRGKEKSKDKVRQEEMGETLAIAEAAARNEKPVGIR